MIDTKLITVLMTVYNNATTLSESLNSIKNQTYKNWELVIIDDGSNDDSLKIIKNFSSSINKKVKIIINNHNLGIPISLNKSIPFINGDFIARHDGDDLSAKNRFQIQLNFLNNNLEYGFVSNSMYHFNDDGILYKSKIKNKPTKLDFIWGNPFNNAPSLIRKELFFGIGGYSESIFFKKRFEDLDFWFRAYKDGWIGYNLSDALYYVRSDFNSLERIKSHHRLIEFLINLRIFFSFRINICLIFITCIPLLKMLIPNFILFQINKTKIKKYDRN
jgi:glycosyltransferase EpsE